MKCVKSWREDYLFTYFIFWNEYYCKDNYVKYSFINRISNKMPKILSLKKTKTTVQKNQNTITQFFKTTSSTSAVPLTKSIEENQTNRFKRKAISPVKVASKTETVNTTEICDTFKRLKSDLEENHLDDQILHLNSPTKLGRRLEKVDNSPEKCIQTVKTTKNCDTFKKLKSDLDENNFDDQILLLNSPTKLGQDFEKVHNSLEKCVPSPNRLPLCSMDNIQSSPEDAIKSQKLALVTENQLFQSPKKNKTLKKKIDTSSPLRRSPRLANLSPSHNVLQLSPNVKSKAMVALDFGKDDLFEAFNIDDFDEHIIEDLDLSVMQRCEIVESHSGGCITELKLKNSDGILGTCLVEGIWNDNPLTIGEKVSIIATKGDDNKYHVNNTSGLLVLRPDHLMSSTSVVAGVFCRRKAVLQDRFRGIDCANDAMTIGTIIHELVQKALTEKISSPDSLRELAADILKESIHMLYEAGVSIDVAMASMNTYIQPLSEFIKFYVLHNNKTNSINKKDKWHGHINEILDIEENVCCPQLGVKGKIDATLKVTIHERKGKHQSIVPLELKSGKASGSAEHRGQLVLYNMMLATLGGRDPAHGPDQRGLLLYLRDKVDLREVSCGYPERRDLVMLRNQLVQFLAASPHQTDPEKIVDIEDAAHVFRQELPDPVHHENACSKCPYLTICSLYIWNTEGPVVSDRHPLSKLRDVAIGHLSLSHIKYFLHWAALLKLEEKGQMMSAPLHALWTETPEKRSSRGVCLCNLKLKSVEASNDRFLHVFQYDNKSDKQGPQEGEFAIVSVEKRPWIAAGTITTHNGGFVHILLERDLSRRYEPTTSYQIDSYESYASTVQNLTNLGALMDDNDQSSKLRRLIIDKNEPQFELKLHKDVGKLGAKLMKKLNIEQQRAVLKALTAKDYMLLQGLPGTGKTQTISVLIQMLVALKQRVLVTAHTHSAVDTVLTRLPSSMKILRLGSSARVVPALASRCEKKVTASCKTPEEIDELYNQMEVVGVTCLGSAHALLSKRMFDVCVVDEATQVLQSTVLRPLLAARRFVLVGDPDQLPPVVRSKSARKLGMEESLFIKLKDTGATQTLKLQYRMNSSLTKLANNVAYDGKLKCATDAVRDSTITIDTELISQMYAADSPWLVTACSINVDEAAIFLDTGPTINSGCKSCANRSEAFVILGVLDALITGGVQPSDIGVIAPYREQVAMLRRSISFLRDVTALEVSTVDQFQGKDKSVILYSCTKSDGEVDRKVKEGEVLNDQRRLAVAVTRAKHKFVVVGDATTLQRYEPFQRLLGACAQTTLQTVDLDRLRKDYGKYVAECIS